MLHIKFHFDWPSCFRGEDFFYIQFNVSFKIISAHMKRANPVGGAKKAEPREKPHGTPANRTWLVSHVASAGRDPTPETAVR